MKKKSTSQSAFFNLRVLVGLLVVLAGVFLALLGSGTLSAFAQAQLKQKIITNSKDPLVPNGFDCSRIHELGIDKQENFRAGAIMSACGQTQGGAASIISQVIQKLPLPRAIKKLLTPLAYGATDVELVTGAESSPNVTQSETFTTANPDNPDQIVVAYNDSRGRNANPINISGASVSTDGGNTFTRLTCANNTPPCHTGQSPFSGTVGDPVILYHKPSGTWVTTWLDTLCGGQGLGGYKSTTPWDPNSWTHYCAHNNDSDDRESGWADNNPSSPFFGRMYISWNDFNFGNANIFVTFSTDGGTTWHSPVMVSTQNTFVRDVQITGDLAGSGTVYIAGMDEGGGGFPHNDTNLIFKSTDGGNTWNNTYTGLSFPGPGVTAVGYFACMFTDGGGYWRHEGWGQPAAINNFVHLVYAQHGAGNDPGDVYYIRSTDGGFTFGAPLKLNTDATTRPQWQPNLSVSPTGSLLATWYDARESASCTRGNPAVPCYRMWSRKSNDNGVTWLPDDALSDVVSPLPAQPDPGIQPTYAGDYDYGSAILPKHVTSWVDGRVAINGQSQQDTFTDRELAGLAVTTTDPACNSVVFTQPTDFTVNVSVAVDPATLEGSDFTVNGIAADGVDYTPGETTMIFHFNSTPVINQGEQTMHIPAGAFNSASSGQPVLEFQCTFRYDATLLQVTSTDPPVGGTFTGPGTSDLVVNFNEPVDPNSVSTGSLQLSGTAATVTNVQVINNNMTAEFTINFTGVIGGTVTASIPAGAITDQFGNPNAPFSGDYQYIANFCDSALIQNEGFETGAFPPWAIDGFSNAPVVTTDNPHSGTFSVLAGRVSGPEPNGQSSFYQQFGPVPADAILSFWHWDYTTDTITFDWQDAYITNTNGQILQIIFHQCQNGQTWLNTTVDMAPYAGQTVRVKFLVHQNGAGEGTGMYVDDVVLATPCGTPSPTPTATPSPPRATPRPRPTPHPRP
jgi:Bacterial Ig-like domain